MLTEQEKAAIEFAATLFPYQSAFEMVDAITNNGIVLPDAAAICYTDGRIAMIPHKVRAMPLSGLTDDQKFFLVAAHELAHKWQFERGDTMPPVTVFCSSDEYEDAPHEIEAVQISALLLGKYSPELQGATLTWGKRTFKVGE